MLGKILGLVMSLTVATTAVNIAFVETAQARTCTATCDPEVSKPCGQVCISKYKQCHKPTTSACMGKAGRSTKKVYDNPTYVEPSETKKSNEAN